MRARLAIAVVLLFLGGQAAAQPSEAAKADRQLVESGRWSERLAEALTLGMEGQQELNQAMRALVAPPTSRERIVAGAPGLRRLIERSRADLRRSNAIIDSLPPSPPEMVAEIAPRLVADARAHNARMFDMLDAFDDFAVAVGKSDISALDRIMPRMMEGALATMSQQRLLVRNRQASLPVTEAGHQSLGVVGQLYRAMEAVFRGSTAAKEKGGAGAEPAAAALRGELQSIAGDTRSLAAAGRRNLEREIAEIEAPRSSRDPAEARLMERVRSVYDSEARIFALADRLVAFAEANKGVTGAQLGGPGSAPLLPDLIEMEADYMAITLEQAALLARE